MKFQIEVIKSKIHRVTVTQADPTQNLPEKGGFFV